MVEFIIFKKSCLALAILNGVSNIFMKFSCKGYGNALLVQMKKIKQNAMFAKI